MAYEIVEGTPAQEVVAETPPEETPPETPPAEVPPEPAQPPKPGEPEYTKAVQRRIDQITKEKHDETRRADGLLTENEALKRKADAGTRPMPPAPSSFTDDDGVIDQGKYEMAMVKHEDSLYAWREAQKVPAATSAAAETPPVADVSTFMERSASLREKHEDFDATINTPVFTRPMMDAILVSEQGPDIAYFLGKNEAEGMRIGGLPPASVLKEIGKLEARFSAGSTSRSVSGAPTPISPVTGTAIVGKDPEKMTTEQWMEHNKQRDIEKIKKSKQALGG